MCIVCMCGKVDATRAWVKEAEPLRAQRALRVVPPKCEVVCVTCCFSVSQVDAPAHFIAGGRTISDIAASELVQPLVCMDVSRQCAADPLYELSVPDIEHHEALHGRIPSKVGLTTGRD